MPVIASRFDPPKLVRQADIQTIVPALFRRLPRPPYSRERLELPDGDFLDLDWVRNGCTKLVVLSHGLEGSTISKYLVGMVTALSRRAYDTVAWNMRGCSGEPNRLTRGYHSGKWDDLSNVVDHVSKGYTEVYLVGFSVGGNITLLYLALGNLGPSLKRAVVVCPPCDLEECADEMARPRNRVYMNWFLHLLRQKLIGKGLLEPGSPEDREYRRFRTFHEFDARYTAPIFGFADAYEYWRVASSAPHLSKVCVPTLFISPKNDSFLGTNSHPYEIARSSKALFLETPDSGGHVGFYNGRLRGESWLEARVPVFLETGS